MTYPERIPAIAYLRTDLSGDSRELQIRQVRQLSIRLGYDLSATIEVDSHLAGIAGLSEAIQVHEAEAVIVPSAAHLGDRLEYIVDRADVIELSGKTHARWSPIAAGVLTPGTSP